MTGLFYLAEQQWNVIICCLYVVQNVNVYTSVDFALLDSHVLWVFHKFE